MRRSVAQRLLAPCAALLLAGCGGRDAPAPEPDDDPALTAALAGQIMVDPDLVGENRANSAAAMPSRSDAVPTVDAHPEAVAAARAEALRLVGGPGRMRKAPEAEDSSSAQAALAGAARGIGEGCTERVRFTARWAARLPRPFPVYPRGAVNEAAGSDDAGCALRVVSFVTPVPLGEVMDFYFTRARGAGYSASRLLHDRDDVLAGAKGNASYVVYARRLGSGNTEVDLVTSGGLGT